MGTFNLNEADLRSDHFLNADILLRPTADDDRIENIKSIIATSQSLEDRLSQLDQDLYDGTRIGLVLNDRNRPTPTSIVLEQIWAAHPSIFDKVMKVHIATGTHKAPTEDDLRAILGPLYTILRERVHIHDAKDEKVHRYICTTKLGTEVRIDRALDDQDILFFINSVEPHYFAGYTGGRKSILPGMAAFSTVERNHSHALDPGSRTLGLEGNPVHEDMENAVRYYLKDRKHLSVQVVQGIGKVLTSVHVGDIFTSFRKGVKAANEQFCIPVKGMYDIVVTIARPPMDRTLYQAQKAIENGKLALRDGGVIILVAGCLEGIGQSTFWDLITSSPDRERTLKEISEGYVLGYHKAAKLLQLSKRAHIHAVCGIDKDELAKGFITGFSDIDAAMASARDIIGKDPRVLVIPDGTMTVPMVG
ncbi:MAG: nickel-dependent lactate racemase [Candidatus Thermoplasmatota archaeon]|nr:nickel-dependent lactate racemase [Candidatus Thermoplasmatota archaeon]